ncbi:hypothetical protein SAMN05660657_00593 [Geodermatophilus amargosae]|uniref:Uncharacterized protein n=1 Tax=Geodermatophilus amargosae TaxID=1296565 RepID=A0A1I6XRG8_9ACTN|nr:hypothetical protein SAMN05660657_00593 [Geodermatophilus amargosae]
MWAEHDYSRDRCPAAAHTAHVPDADDFRALARSSPWRWTTLRFTERRRHGSTWSGPVRAWLWRPDLLRVEDADGHLLEVIRERSSVSGVLGSGPWDPPPPVTGPVLRPDGLVAVRPDGLQADDPMWQDYRWVAELDPAELADGLDDGAPLVIEGVREVEHAGRAAWEALVVPTGAYEPRCGCCPLLRSRRVDELEWGSVPEGREYPSASFVRLDVRTGVCVWAEALDGTFAGDTHDLRIEAVDEPMADDLFPRPRRQGAVSGGSRTPEEYLERRRRRRGRD